MNHRWLDLVVTPHRCQIITLSNKHRDKLYTTLTLSGIFMPVSVLPLKPIFHCDAKYLALGVGIGQCPQRQNFALGIPKCWYLGANANPFCVLPDAFYPTRNLKCAFYPTRNPNASQWNIGCVGSLALGLCVGHVHFIFFVLISIALDSQRKRSFQ